MSLYSGTAGLQQETFGIQSEHDELVEQILPARHSQALDQKLFEGVVHRDYV